MKTELTVDQDDRHLFEERKQEFLRIAALTRKTENDRAAMSMFIITYYETEVIVLKTKRQLNSFLSSIRNLLVHGDKEQVTAFYRSEQFNCFVNYIQDPQLTIPESYEKKIFCNRRSLSPAKVKNLIQYYCTSDKSTNSELFYYYAGIAFEQFLELDNFHGNDRKRIESLRNLIFHGEIKYTEKQFLQVKEGIDLILQILDRPTIKTIDQVQRLPSRVGSVASASSASASAASASAASATAASESEEQISRLRNIIDRYEQGIAIQAEMEVASYAQFYELMQDCIKWAKTVHFSIDMQKWKIVCKIIELNTKYVDADFYLLKQLRDEWLKILEKNIDNINMFQLYQLISPFFALLRSSEIDPKIADRVLQKLIYVRSGNFPISITLGLEFIKICRGREENLLEYMKLLLIHFKYFFAADKTLIILNEISIMSFDLSEEFVLEIFEVLGDDSFLQRIKSETNQRLLLESLRLMIARVKSPTTRLNDSIMAIKRKLPTLREKQSEITPLELHDLYELTIESFIANCEVSKLDLNKMLNFKIEAKSFLEALELYMQEVNKYQNLDDNLVNKLIDDLLKILDIFNRNETKFPGNHQTITNPRCFELIVEFLQKYKDSRIMMFKLPELLRASYFICNNSPDSRFKYTVLDVYTSATKNKRYIFEVIQFLSCFSDNESAEVQNKLERIYGDVINYIVNCEYDIFERKLAIIFSADLKFNAKQYDMRIVEKILSHIPNVRSPESAYSHLFALELILKKMNKGAEIERYNEELLPLVKILRTDVTPGFKILEFLDQNRQYCIFKVNSGTSSKVSADRSPRQARAESREVVDLLPLRKDGTITRNYGPILVTALWSFCVGNVDTRKRRSTPSRTSAYVIGNSDSYASYLRMLHQFLDHWDELDVADDARVQIIISRAFQLISTRSQIDDYLKHIIVKLQTLSIVTGVFTDPHLELQYTYNNILKACLLMEQNIHPEVQNQAKLDLIANIKSCNMTLNGNPGLIFSLLETIFFVHAEETQKSRYPRYLAEILEIVRNQPQEDRIKFWNVLTDRLRQLSKNKRINILGSDKYSHINFENFLSPFYAYYILRIEVPNPAPAVVTAPSAPAVVTARAASASAPAPAAAPAAVADMRNLTRNLIKFIDLVSSNDTTAFITNQNNYKSLEDFFKDANIYFSRENRETFISELSGSYSSKFNIVVKSLQYLSTKLQNEKRQTKRNANYLPRDLVKGLAETIQEAFVEIVKPNLLTEATLKFSAINITKTCQLTHTPVNIDVQKLFLDQCIRLLSTECLSPKDQNCYTAMINIIFYKTSDPKRLESYQESYRRLMDHPNFKVLSKVIDNAEPHISLPEIAPAPQVASAASARAGVSSSASASVEMV